MVNVSGRVARAGVASAGREERGGGEFIGWGGEVDADGEGGRSRLVVCRGSGVGRGKGKGEGYPGIGCSVDEGKDKSVSSEG